MKANRLAKLKQRKAVKAKARKPVVIHRTYFWTVDCGAPLWDAKRPYFSERIVDIVKA